MPSRWLAVSAAVMLVAVTASTTLYVTSRSLESVTNRELVTRYETRLARLNMLIDTLPGGVLIVNAQNGVVKYMNEGAEEIFGYSRRQIVGDGMYRLICGEEYRARHKKFFNEDRWKQTFESHEGTILRVKGCKAHSPNGPQRVDLEIRPVRENGTYEYLVFVDPTTIVKEFEPEPEQVMEEEAAGKPPLN